MRPSSCYTWPVIFHMICHHTQKASEDPHHLGNLTFIHVKMIETQQKTSVEQLMSSDTINLLNRHYFTSRSQKSLVALSMCADACRQCLSCHRQVLMVAWFYLHCNHMASEITCLLLSCVGRSCMTSTIYPNCIPMQSSGCKRVYCSLFNLLSSLPSKHCFILQCNQRRQAISARFYRVEQCNSCHFGMYVGWRFAAVVIFDLWTKLHSPKWQLNTMYNLPR